MPSRATSHETWTACPHCKLTLPASRVVCNGCGAVVPIEMASRRVRGLLPRLAASVTKRFEADPAAFYVWALACVPLFVAPPVCALLLHQFRSRQKRQVSEIDAPDQAEWVPIIAIANIIMSIAFWVVAGREISAALQAPIGSLWDWLHSFHAAPHVPVKSYQITA